jgi:hypothetical protein
MTLKIADLKKSTFGKKKETRITIANIAPIDLTNLFQVQGEGLGEFGIRFMLEDRPSLVIEGSIDDLEAFNNHIAGLIANMRARFPKAES